ncbi:FAD-binding oxidoreductase [Nocardioides marmorisolisilvae]|uniref:FAD-binding oxidoreductase n=1 Tax=Nocardioides marmorisolisilvae TaxID=1542737 RepID=A0A3N0DIH5_9ACTN|nr:FAD-dependent oxidoreductase [Nocardioides marmorisolisilvae]RNL75492.1 FAD-binding oxidoreductase [Nocardioides marmorisolisilvae]
MTLTRREVLLLGVGVLAASTGCAEKSPSSPATTPPASTPPTPSTSRTATSGPGWSQLARHVDGTLARPGSATYDQARLTENPRYDGARPLAVLTAANADDVATALRFAQDNGLPVAIRSGGHSYPGWSAGAGRLVIDCRRLSRVTLNGTTATIGAGAALAPVYAAIADRGRAIPGGSCATVGIGGLTLGGGVGVLTRALGLTCDSVTGLQVVTADGRTRTVDAHHDPDLFWALRGGGGGHLGVVTSFRFATAPAPRLQTFYLSWPIAAAPQVIQAWQAWGSSADARLWSTLKVLGGATHPSGPTILVAGTWTGAGSPDLSGLLTHCPKPSTHTTTPRTYAQAMASYAGCSSIPVARCHTGPGGDLDREAFGATSHIGYRALPAAGIGTLLDHVHDAGTELKEAGISMDLLGGKVADVDPASTAFVHREALMTVQYTATFTGARASAADTFVRGFRSAMTPYWENHAYVNYADAKLADPLAAYFGANATRLAQVRRTYDPHRFFTQPQGY